MLVQQRRSSVDARRRLGEVQRRRGELDALAAAWQFDIRQHPPRMDVRDAGDHYEVVDFMQAGQPAAAG